MAMRVMTIMIAVVVLLAAGQVIPNAGAQDGQLATEVAELRTRVAALEMRVSVLDGTPATAATPAAVAGPPYTLRGTVTVTDGYGDPVGEVCANRGAFEDINPGTDITIRDQAGVIVAMGAVGEGVSVRLPMGNPTAAKSDACRLSLLVAGIPDAPFYSVEVGRRGGLTYSHAELEAVGWEIALNLA